MFSLFDIGKKDYLSWIILILTSIPEDLPQFDLQIIRILWTSYAVFILFNFLGDLLSINITRHVLAKIVAGKCNFLKYLGIDIAGIMLGYFITLLPTLTVTIICLITNSELNPWIHYGLLGNALIPFFLFIFATTSMPFSFFIFAFIAVFSVTIPTAIYLILMVFCFAGYKTYKSFKSNEDLSVLENVAKLLSIFAKTLLFIAPIIAALAIILTNM